MKRKSLNFDADASVNAFYNEWCLLFQAAIGLNSAARYHMANEDGTYVNALKHMDDATILEANMVLDRMQELYDLIWKLDSQFAMSVDMGTDMFLQCRDIVTFLMELGE